MKEMSELERHYFDLSEVYLGAYYDATLPALKIQIAMGIIVELESDLAEFHLKSKETEKSKRQKERLNMLRASLDAFTVTAERNKQFLKVMKKLYDRNSELEKEVEKLNKQLEWK